MTAYSFGIFLLIAHLLCVTGEKIQVGEVPTYGMNREACSKVRMEMNSQMSNTMCKPRMVMVKLKPEPGYVYLPEVVSVNRCHGACNNNFSCFPAASNMTSVVVRREHVSTQTATCERVFVKEHTECKCLCTVMKEHCNKHQIYMEDECACKCMNTEEKRKCNAMPGRRWNPESCSCVCDMPEKECSTGLKWLPQFCKCLQVMDGPNIMH